MSYLKRLFLLGNLLATVGVLFVFLPAASPAFAATTGEFSAHQAQALAPATSLTPNNACPPSLSEGADNTWVMLLQYRLNAAAANHLSGLSSYLATDGSFGPLTEAAVVAFQKTVGIGSSGAGVVGVRTWSALGFCQNGWAPAFNSLYPTTFTACPANESENAASNNTDLVMAIQDLLNNEYFYGWYSDNDPYSWTPWLTSDGGFGPETYVAVVDFQVSSLANIGWSGDGVVGQRTWSALGMCY